MIAIKLPVSVESGPDAWFRVRDCNGMLVCRAPGPDDAKQIALSLNRYDPMIQALQAIAGSKTLLSSREVRAIAQNLLAKFEIEKANP